jgi:arabinofuranan 3-O-arabinosyltransferase
MTSDLLPAQSQIVELSHGDAPVSRGALAAVSAVIAALCFLQAPNRIVADTKLDVAIAPLAFLGHALNLWSPQQAFGGVPYQAYGYFLPMGPFFVAGHLLGLPTWVIQRLWVAVLLIAAFWGIVRLAEALGIGSPSSRIVAALAYVFTPPITLLGGVSASILPFSLLPWVIIPLVHGARGGSTRRAACRSGVAILLMGGINAASVVAILPVPFLWFVTRTPGKRRRQLFEWWILAVLLACAWWAASLLLEGRYGFNLVPYTETPGVTTAVTSLVDVFRGNSYWFGFDQLDPTAIKSGLEAVTSPLMIIAGAVLGALGLYGLAHREMKERTFLVGSLALGAVLVGAGYAGGLGAPFSGFVREALNGPLAPFRNVWKFQPMVNMALALGLAHAVHILAGPLRRAVPTRSLGDWKKRSRILVIPLAGVAIVGLSIPFLTNDFYPPGSFVSVPNYWQATASWLNAHAGTSTSLLVPGSSVGYYTWGSPLDEPMQWLSSSNWAVRGLDPDSSVGNIETLDTVDQILSSGVPNGGLSAFLAQSGVRYLVERNDLGPEVGAPTPLQVHEVLSATPGLVRAATFGPRHTILFGSLPVSLPAIEIYEVQGTVPVVSTAPVGSSLVVSGGAQTLLSLDQLGLDPGNRAILLAGDGGVVAPAQTWVDSDTTPRIDVQYGSIWSNETYVLTRSEVSPVTGNPPAGWTIVDGSAHQTVATFIGAADVTASSFGATNLVQAPENQPAAAFDGDPDTAWEASGTNNSVGQWLQVDLDRSITVHTIGIELSASAQSPRVTQVTVTTNHGSVRQSIRPSGANQLVRVPTGSMRWLRVTFTKVLPPRQSSPLPLGAGIRELTIPGVTIQKAEVVPQDELRRFAAPGARPPLYVFTSPAPGHTAGEASGGEDQEPRMLRFFTTPTPETYTVRGVVTARPGGELASVVGLLGLRTLTAQPFHLACGQGPVITVDGKQLETEVNGLDRDLSGFEEMPFVTCGPSSPLTLSAGVHLLAGNVGGYLKVTSVALLPSSAPPYAPAGSGRSVSVTNWASDHRSVVVGAGARSYLIVHQNFNSGWNAQLGHTKLAPARIDGWQQAWVLPAGSGGVVTLSYAPDELYQFGLIVGAALALLLVILALWPDRRGNDSRARGPRTGPPALAAIGASLIVLFLLGGALALALPVVLLVAWFVRARRWLAVVAALSYLAAGVAAVAQIGRFPASDVGVFGWPAQAASMLALATVLGAWVVQSGRWTRSGNGISDTDERGPTKDDERPREAASDASSRLRPDG